MVVVDASLVVKWLVPEVDSDRATQLLLEWTRNGILIVAPIMILTEVSNALHKRVQNQLVNIRDVRRLLDQLSGLLLVDYIPMHESAIEIASILGEQDSYDCHYLALSEDLDCEFWTADRAFYDVAHEKYPQVRYIRPIPLT